MRSCRVRRDRITLQLKETKSSSEDMKNARGSSKEAEGSKQKVIREYLESVKEFS